jgi:hypothetical protein
MGAVSMVSAIDPTKPADGVPAAKADLRANLLAAKLEIESLQATKVGHGEPLDMEGQQLIHAQLRGVSEVSPTASVSAGTLILNLEVGNVFEVVLTEDVVSFILANPPTAGLAVGCCLILKQDNAGGRTVAWPSSIRWASGVRPMLSGAKNAVDFLVFVTRDGGATWYGFVSGTDFR